MENLLELIHGYNIYENFDLTKYDHRLVGWNINEELFHSLIEQTQPEIIIELGSWYGASAIAMGNIIKKLGLNTKIICVDTWLGSYEFIGLYEKDEERKLLPTFGYPNAYYQFLTNVCHNNMQDIIIPFPQTIRMACKWLANHNILSKLIYVDGNNDNFDVYNDIYISWKLLDIDGIIFGDDYNSISWPSVDIGLNKFCSENRIKPIIHQKFPNHWTLKKYHVN
jgi:hypothetical protein